MNINNIMEALGSIKHGDYKELEFLTLPRPKVTADTDVLIEIAYERKTSFRHRESRNLGNWGLGQGYAKSLDNDGIMKFRR